LHPNPRIPPSQYPSTVQTTSQTSTSCSRCITVITGAMELLHYPPTSCHTSCVTTMAPTSILRIAHVASPRVTAPRHSQYLLYSTLMLVPVHLSIGTLLLGSSRSGGSEYLASASTPTHLAGTSLTSPIYGSDVFNLTLSHEIMRLNETLSSLHTKVIESCIDIIVSRPVLREQPLVH
jgi:hypothetical protein